MQARPSISCIFGIFCAYVVFLPIHLWSVLQWKLKKELDHEWGSPDAREIACESRAQRVCCSANRVVVVVFRHRRGLSNMTSTKWGFEPPLPWSGIYDLFVDKLGVFFHAPYPPQCRPHIWNPQKEKSNSLRSRPCLPSLLPPSWFLPHWWFSKGARFVPSSFGGRDICALTAWSWTVIL